MRAIQDAIQRRAPAALSALVTTIWLGGLVAIAQPPLPPPLPPAAETAAEKTATVAGPEPESLVPGRLEAAAQPDLHASLPKAERDALEGWMTYLIEQNFPARYVEEDDWGRTKRVYAGFKITRDDWKLSTKRRWKRLEHGVWQRMIVTRRPSSSDQGWLVRSELLDWNEATGTARVRLHVDADLDLFARRMRYNYGVKLFSVHAEATAQVQLVLEATVSARLEYKQLPPVVVLDPRVEAAELKLKRLHLDRLSLLRGDPAEWLGDEIERWMRRKWLPRQNAKLVDRTNAQIEKQRDRLRFSVNDALRRWWEAEPQTKSPASRKRPQ